MRCGYCPVNNYCTIFCPTAHRNTFRFYLLVVYVDIIIASEKITINRFILKPPHIHRNSVICKDRSAHIKWRIILSTCFSTAPLRSWNHDRSPGIMVGVCHRVLVGQCSRRTTLIVNAAAPAIVQTPVRTKVDVTIAAWPNGIELTGSFLLLVCVILLIKSSENHRATGRLGRIGCDV